MYFVVLALLIAGVALILYCASIMPFGYVTPGPAVGVSVGVGFLALAAGFIIGEQYSVEIRPNKLGQTMPAYDLPDGTVYQCDEPYDDIKMVRRVWRGPHEHHTPPIAVDGLYDLHLQPNDVFMIVDGIPIKMPTPKKEE